MQRSFAILSLLALAGAGGLAPAARASDVHFGLSLAIPFDHGMIGIAVGNGHGHGHHHGHGPYYGHGYHGHHGYAYAPRSCGVHGPWLPSSYIGVAINTAPVVPVYVAPAPAPVVALPPAAVPAPEPVNVEVPEPSVFLPKSTDMSGTLQLRLNGTTYYHHAGRFFRRTSSGYVSTPAPVGAIAQRLPGDAEAITLGGQEYFESGPVVFKMVSKGFMLIDG